MIKYYSYFFFKIHGFRNNFNLRRVYFYNTKYERVYIFYYFINLMISIIYILIYNLRA